MKTLIHSLIVTIRRKVMISVIVSGSLVLVSASMMRQSGACVKTSAAPRAIISLELAFTQTEASGIKREWDATICKNDASATAMAIKNTKQDFLFIVGYTSLLIVLATLLPRKQDIEHDVYLIKLALAAGACDVVENFFMLIYLRGTAIPPFFFGVFASIKFLLIIFIVMNILTGIYRKIAGRGRVW
jgi:hypothetical protein